jgi:hypothetical protein
LHESLEFLFRRPGLVQVPVRLSQELKVILEVIKDIPHRLVTFYRCTLIQVLSQVRLKTPIGVTLKVKSYPCDLFWDCFKHFFSIRPFIIGPNEKTNGRDIF